ncbi:Holliday junction resolvase RuvX [Leptolyngbya iicbica]|uniref:Putative pre-16S rRNA nuclease n=2 Tax=Cyanophyceae TaxID=3028117 RepID=A0A4Q7E5V2_9CYAN|nr:Holliday junction resolvase RuvX [Leptolyngbya sp. LK]RZM77245.1 Holliday junction resolvase RuvX [Leptolyngbya sp. LK]
MPQPHISALALDIGRRRIGVAGCDRLGLLVTELPTVQNRSFRTVVDEIKAIATERRVNVLVVGLPYSMNGELGKQAVWVQTFAEKLSSILQIPVEYVDERLTSFQAEQMLQAEGVTLSRHNKGLIDQKAAAIILQQWLDQRDRPSTVPSSPSPTSSVTGDPE